jgi:hypothetical protein
VQLVGIQIYNLDIARIKNQRNEILTIKPTRCTNSIYKWKPYATRPKGRPRVRWDDDVRNDLRKMGVNNWKQMTQERKKWKEIIEQAKTHKRVVELKKKKMH